MDKNKNKIPLKSSLILSENKIEHISQVITNTELETEKNHRELEREYSIYTKHACMYIAELVRNIKYADFQQRRITYEGWKFMVRLADKLIKGDKNNG